MFTGIVEAVGTIKSIKKIGSNVQLVLASPLSHLFKIDQSVLHNGVCLTVVNKTTKTHTVTLVKETLLKTTFKNSHIGTLINLERALKFNGRLDGHLVSGHVDNVLQVHHVQDMNGSYHLTFKIQKKDRKYIIEKGSICINGISLTVFNVRHLSFTVAIIPYTWAHTQISSLKPGDLVNVEFDLVGKYILQNSQLPGTHS